MKKKGNTIKPAVCPRCGRTYTARPAVSRTDSSMRICPDCGTREALESIGVGADEQEKILRTIHRSQA
ncbi:MAG: hypothetical protein K2N78_08675 [Oscillospiraceae bacterium]|nr:hypothetical protein [Oscillospiraceae bacterium]